MEFESNYGSDKYKMTIGHWIFLNAKFGKPSMLAHFPEQLEKLTDPGFLDYLGIDGEDRNKIDTLSSRLHDLSDEGRLKLSGILRNRFKRNKIVQSEMLKELYKPNNIIFPESGPAKMLAEVNLELKKNFCWESFVEVSKTDSGFRKWLSTLPCFKYPQWSEIFLKPETLAKFGLEERPYDIWTMTDLQKKLYNIVSGRERINELPEESLDISEIRLEKEKYQSFIDHIRSINNMRDKGARLGLKLPVYSGTVLSSIFDDKTLSDLGIEILRERQFTIEELKEDFMVQSSRYRFAGHDVIAVLNKRMKELEASNSAFAPPKIEKLLEKESDFPMKVVQRVLTDWIIPALETKIQRLSIAETRLAKKQVSLSWETGQAVDRRATEEYIAAKSTHGFSRM